MVYQTAPFSMTLNDPKPRLQSFFDVEMAKYTAIVTMEGEQETVPKLSNATNFNDLE